MHVEIEAITQELKRAVTQKMHLIIIIITDSKRLTRSEWVEIIDTSQIKNIRWIYPQGRT